MPDNVEDVFLKASGLHSSGADLSRAEALYRSVLAAQPKHAHALHQLGALLTQVYGKEKFDEAQRLLLSAVQQLPSCAKFRNSLGVVYQAAGRWREAVEAFERANEKDPLNAAVLMNLARALREVGRQQRAAEVYGTITTLQPDHLSAYYRRGAILRSLRRNEEALAALRQHLRLHPGHQASKFWIAAITGDTAGMAAAPSDMVAGLFDQYADHFDDHLVNKLQYRTPEALRDQLLAAYDSARTASSAASTGGDVSCSGRSGPAGGSSPPRWRRCVDLGCGTGLMGPLLLPYCDVVEGVDLSPGMVDQAGRRGCYSRLAVGELVAFLEGETAALASAAGPQDRDGGGAAVPYDLLVAADVFVYIGDLLPVMRAAAAAAAPGAVLAFSTEALELAATGKVNRGLAAPERRQRRSSGEAASGASSAPARGGGCSGVAERSSACCPGLRLQVTGRYAHSQEYLQMTGASCGWELVSASQSIIRYNGGDPIWGHLCVMRLGAQGGDRAGGQACAA